MFRRNTILILFIITAFAIAGCQPTTQSIEAQATAIPTTVAPTNTPKPTNTPEPTATEIPTDTPTIEPTATTEPTATPTDTPEPTATATKSPHSFLVEPGPYEVGYASTKWTDADRGDRVIDLAIYYPAVNASERQGRDAEVNTGAGPYPLILHITGLLQGASSSKMLHRHLASHGFIIISVGYQSESLETLYVERPLDAGFVYENLDENLNPDLLAVIDREKIGLMGYSNGGYAAFHAAGASIDPLYWEGKFSSYQEYDISGEQGRSLGANWDGIAAHWSQYGATSDDSLWAPLATIDADVLFGIAPSPLFLFGERGLSSLSIPTAIMVGTKDEYVHYKSEIAALFPSIGTEERYLITLIGRDHFLEQKEPDHVKTFATAFLGYYLQGRTEYEAYLSESFVNRLDDLHFGIYE